MTETVITEHVLTRKRLWEALRDRGWPPTWSYFSWLCSTGAGPEPVGWFGGRPLYTLEAGLQWANDRLKASGTKHPHLKREKPPEEAAA
jgi:hypothetical protein